MNGVMQKRFRTYTDVDQRKGPYTSFVLLYHNFLTRHFPNLFHLSYFTFLPSRTFNKDFCNAMRISYMVYSIKRGIKI